MSGDPWTRDPVVAARLEQLNDAYARGEIDLDDLERRTADVIERGHRPPWLIGKAAGTDHPPATVPAPSTRTLANAAFSASPRRRALSAGVMIAIVIGALGALASSLPNEKLVPNAVGMYPQEAIDAINAAGLRTSSHGGIHEQESQGFIVCETIPAAGAALDPDESVVEIFSRRDCEPKTALAKAYAREWRSREHGTSDEH